MHYKFTGKERDAESGLDYFGARYYASNMGRWMSPDWADKPEAVPYSSLANPQSLNLYGYVLNNPLSKADADGHATCPPVCTVDPTEATIEDAPQSVVDAIAKPLIESAPAITNVLGSIVSGVIDIALAPEVIVGAVLFGGTPAGNYNDGHPKLGPVPSTTQEHQTPPEPQTSASGAGARKGGGDKQTGPKSGKDQTLDGRVNQLKDIKTAQANRRAGKTKKKIDSTKKSEQNLDKALKDIHSLSDVQH